MVSGLWAGWREAQRVPGLGRGSGRRVPASVQVGVMQESSMAVLITKQVSSEWGKLDGEWVLAGLNEVVRMELAQC